MAKSKNKTLSRIERLQHQVEQQRQEDALQKALAVHRKQQKAVRQAIRTGKVPAFTGQADSADHRIRVIAHAHQELRKYPSRLAAFEELMQHLFRCHCHRLLADTAYIQALAQIARYDTWFIRPVRAWRPDSYNPEIQFGRLLRHLFAQYDVPVFLDQVWLHANNAHEKQWFLDIGSGISVRKLRQLPVPFTKRMAHAFLHAPWYCTPTQAVRYAQVVALGGDEWLAWHLNRTAIGRNNFRDDAFWLTVIQFLVQAALFDVRMMRQLITYLEAQRNLQPNFSMKGRTMEALVRQMQVWQQAQYPSMPRNGENWLRSGIQPYEADVVNGWHQSRFTITELLSGNDLRAEGASMKHCVFTYAASCYQGRTAIFSLRSDWERLVTIEVDLKNKRIVQAKGRYNASPEPVHLNFIRAWAASEGLSVAKWL